MDDNSEHYECEQRVNNAANLIRVLDDDLLTVDQAQHLICVLSNKIAAAGEAQKLNKKRHAQFDVLCAGLDMLAMDRS